MRELREMGEPRNQKNNGILKKYEGKYKKSLIIKANAPKRIRFPVFVPSRLAFAPPFSCTTVTHSGNLPPSPAINAQNFSLSCFGFGRIRGPACPRTGLYACIFFARGKKGYRSNPLRVYPPAADSNGNSGGPRRAAQAKALTPLWCTAAFFGRRACTAFVGVTPLDGALVPRPMPQVPDTIGVPGTFFFKIKNIRKFGAWRIF
jgi:hypothetical protein